MACSLEECSRKQDTGGIVSAILLILLSPLPVHCCSSVGVVGGKEAPSFGWGLRTPRLRSVVTTSEYSEEYRIRGVFRGWQLSKEYCCYDGKYVIPMFDELARKYHWGSLDGYKRVSRCQALYPAAHPVNQLQTTARTVKSCWENRIEREQDNLQCRFCHQEVTEKVGCVRVRFLWGDDLRPIPYGEEKGQSKVSPNCRDCLVPVGSFHHPDCCVERCPACFGQAVLCLVRRPRENARHCHHDARGPCNYVGLEEKLVRLREVEEGGR